MAELYQLQEQEIPEAMTQLQDSHNNLKKVADYCEGLYLQAESADKKPALEETRGYTTQALASVAYQINTLATSFLSLLDLQAKQLVDMESSINHLSQTVTIHKEKVARREIGVLTTNKSFFRPPGVKTPGIIFPEQPEKPVKYIRKPIDYTILDGVGAGGVKSHVVSSSRPPRSGSVSSASSSSHGNIPPHHVNNSNHPLPSAAGTLNRGHRYGQSIARQNSGPIAPPVAPPSVPSHYMSAQQLQIAQQSGQQANLANPTYGSGMQGAPPPPPMMNTQNGIAGYNGDMMAPPPPLSPPLPPMPDESYNLNQANHRQQADNRYRYYVPNMPPPPPDDVPSPPGSSMPSHPSDFPDYPNSYDRNSYDDSASIGNPVPLPPPLNGGHEIAHPTWAPEVYLEKVIAIFEYEPQNVDELRFHENTVLYVIKKNSDGWWEGVMESEDGSPVCGLFPENYVESLL